MIRKVGATGAVDTISMWLVVQNQPEKQDQCDTFRSAIENKLTQVLPVTINSSIQLSGILVESDEGKQDKKYE